MDNATARPSRRSAIVRQRCPNCLRGQVFTGMFTMNQTCPQCGVRFEREPGYFVGAMYISYLLSVPIVVVAAAILTSTVLRDRELVWSAVAGWGLYLLLVPAVFRYSRIVWMHIDRYFNPDVPQRARMKLVKTTDRRP